MQRLAIIFLLLSTQWPALSLAECGWVLWTKQLSLNLSPLRIIWLPMNAFPSYEECKKEADELPEYQLKEGDLEEDQLKKWGGLIGHQCFPGAFDPREK